MKMKLRKCDEYIWVMTHYGETYPGVAKPHLSVLALRHVGKTRLDCWRRFMKWYRKWGNCPQAKKEGFKPMRFKLVPAK